MELFGAHSFDDITVHNGNRKQNVEQMKTIKTIVRPFIGWKLVRKLEFTRNSNENRTIAV